MIHALFCNSKKICDFTVFIPLTIGSHTCEPVTLSDGRRIQLDKLRKCCSWTTIHVDEVLRPVLFKLRWGKSPIMHLLWWLISFVQVPPFFIWSIQRFMEEPHERINGSQGIVIFMARSKLYMCREHKQSTNRPIKALTTETQWTPVTASV